jgi:hypothetical protein
MYKHQLDVLNQRFGDLEDQILMLDTENKQFKHQREVIEKADL